MEILCSKIKDMWYICLQLEDMLIFLNRLHLSCIIPQNFYSVLKLIKGEIIHITPGWFHREDCAVTSVHGKRRTLQVEWVITLSGTLALRHRTYTILFNPHSSLVMWVMFTLYRRKQWGSEYLTQGHTGSELQSRKAKWLSLRPRHSCVCRILAANCRSLKRGSHSACRLWKIVFVIVPATEVMHSLACTHTRAHTHI